MQPIWYFAVGEQERGPATIEEIRELVGQGLVNSETLVWREGWADWEPLRETTLSSILKQPPPLPSSRRQLTLSPPSLPPSEVSGRALADNSTLGTKKPSVGLYIGAWIIAAITTAILSVLVDHALAAALVKSQDDLPLYFLVAPLLQFLVALLVWVWIYSMFRTLNISKVIPFLWALGGIGVAINIGRTVSDFEKAGVPLSPVYFFSVITGFIVFVVLFRYFFKVRGRLLG